MLNANTDACRCQTIVNGAHTREERDDSANTHKIAGQSELNNSDARRPPLYNSKAIQ